MRPYLIRIIFLFIISYLLVSEGFCQTFSYSLKPSTYYFKDSANIVDILKLPFYPSKENNSPVKRNVLTENDPHDNDVIDLTSSNLIFNATNDNGAIPINKSFKRTTIPNSIICNGLNISNLQIKNIAIAPGANFYLVGDKIGSISFTNAFGNFNLNNLQSNHIVIHNSRLNLSLFGLKGDDLYLWVSNSTISFQTTSLWALKPNLYFNRDSMINFSIAISSERYSINVDSSRVSGQFLIDDTGILNPPNVEFVADTFYNAVINIDDFKLLSLKNCTAIKNHLLIKSERQDKIDSIELTGSDLSQIDFDLPKGFVLVFEKNTPADAKDKMYQELLDNFKRNFSSDNYKDIDIQYKRYRFNQYPIVGPIWSTVDCLWWNYGYAKERIIFLTLLFLIVFFIINLTISRRLFIFYRVFPDKPSPPSRKTTRYKTNNFIVVFIITIYIFFSLRIDFDKIKPKYTSLMIYFFIQYFLGLICLFFLLNAILKV